MADRALMGSLSRGAVHQGVVLVADPVIFFAVTEAPEMALWKCQSSLQPLVLALDGVTDTQVSVKLRV